MALGECPTVLQAWRPSAAPVPLLPDVTPRHMLGLARWTLCHQGVAM